MFLQKKTSLRIKKESDNENFMKAKPKKIEFTTILHKKSENILFEIVIPTSIREKKNLFIKYNKDNILPQYPPGLIPDLSNLSKELFI